MSKLCWILNSILILILNFIYIIYFINIKFWILNFKIKFQRVKNCRFRKFGPVNLENMTRKNLELKFLKNHHPGYIWKEFFLLITIFKCRYCFFCFLLFYYCLLLNIPIFRATEKIKYDLSKSKNEF